MIVTRLASIIPSLTILNAATTLRAGILPAFLNNSSKTTTTALSENNRMSLLSKLRPMASYTNATTEVIDPPKGGKVSILFEKGSVGENFVYAGGVGRFSAVLQRN